MPSVEPFWDPRTERWPGTRDTSGRLRKGDVLYDTHLGAWCDWNDVSGLGVVATDEFQFAPDGTFHWYSLRTKGAADVLVRRSGSWEIRQDALFLRIAQSDEPDVMPRQRVDLTITERQGRLVLRQDQSDDEVRKGISTYFLLPATAGDAAYVLAEMLAKKKATPAALPKPYSMLETLLKASIPAAVQKLNLPESACCARLYYYDSHAPREKYGLTVRIVTESARRKLAALAAGPAHLEEELWHPLAGVANGTPGRNPGLFEVDLTSNQQLSKLFDEIYDHLCEDEDESMGHLRNLARRVSKALNARAWGPKIPVTDDFVVVPADGSGFFGAEYAEDLEATVPPKRLALLRERGYLQ